MMPLWVVLSVATASGLALSFPFTDRVAWPVWIALAPILHAVAAASTKRRAVLTAVAFALTWSLLCLRFYAHLTPGGWIANGIYISLLYVAGLMAIRVLAKRGIWAAVLGSAAVWALLEIVRARMPILAFPWMLLGHAAGDWAVLRQAADLLGVFGISFVMAAVNALLAFIVLPVCTSKLKAPPSTPAARRRCAAVVLAMLFAFLVYGRVQLEHYESRMVRGPRIALIQGCTYHKIERSHEEKQAQLEAHLKLHAQAALTLRDGDPPALICWGETMVPGLFNVEEYAQTFTAAVQRHGIPTLFGADWLHPDDTQIEVAEQRWYNAAFAMDGAGQVAARYAKRRLVPFGEYVPLVSPLPFMKSLRSVTRDKYMPGDAPCTVVELGNVRSAFVLCVEGAHADLAREAAAGGADVLVNPTNDAWFTGTFGAAAHLQAARLRAIEIRRPLIRATNSGISVQVDPLGRLEVPLAPDTVGVAVLDLARLEGDLPCTLTMQLGEAGAATLFVLVLGLAWWLDRRALADQGAKKQHG